MVTRINQKGRKIPWNKGFTKDTHPSVLKISKTLASKPRSNFHSWQQRHRKTYSQLKAGPDLAELYGIMLGDGYIEKCARTERLIISSNSANTGHINHISAILKEIFDKEPKIRQRKTSKCSDVYIYENQISARLEFPTGKKIQHDLRIPKWIKNNEEYLLRCLKGLFESDGNWTVDKSNYTSVISLRNNLQGLLDDVFMALKKFGFHPQRRKLDVRLARKKEVLDFINKICFRNY